jgi:ABC-type nitrate/sulfonate/bicarbonate transport system ATPase subunit
MNIDIARKTFPALGETPERSVLSNLSLEIADGEFVAVFGPSGCGKTTLLNIVAGLDEDFDGRIDWESRGATNAKIGYVFQTPRLLPWKTVRDNVRLAITGVAPEKADEKIDVLLRKMGLEDHRDAYPERLSVGQARRAALARAFAIDPNILLMDEPFVSLDASTADRLRCLLLQVLKEHQTSVIFVTHDLGEAIMLADRIVFLSESPAEVIADVSVDLGKGSRAASDIEAFKKKLMKNKRLHIS